MNETALERPSVLLPFRWLVLGALGLAVVAFTGGRYLFQRYGGYRPLALMHVPQTLRYRARVEVNDPQRAPLILPLLDALDPQGRRKSSFQERLGTSLGGVVREVAFGVGASPSEFVLVLGLQLGGGVNHPGKALCDALRSDGLKLEPNEAGCRLADGSLVAQTADGALLLSSRPALVKDLLGRAEIGDRLGFSGPSVRGVAPEVEDLQREVATLSQALAAKYP
jgi:hypothetical protein